MKSVRNILLVLTVVFALFLLSIAGNLGSSNNSSQGDPTKWQGSPDPATQIQWTGGCNTEGWQNIGVLLSKTSLKPTVTLIYPGQKASDPAVSTTGTWSSKIQTLYIRATWTDNGTPYTWYNKNVLNPAACAVLAGETCDSVKVSNGAGAEVVTVFNAQGVPVGSGTTDADHYGTITIAGFSVFLNGSDRTGKCV